MHLRSLNRADSDPKIAAAVFSFAAGGETLRHLCLGPQTVRAGTLAFGFFFIFGAIGFYYRNFNQVADEEVIEMLKRFPVTKLEQAP